MGKGAPDEAIEIDQLILEVDSVDSSQHEHDLRQRQTGPQQDKLTVRILKEREEL